MSKLRLREVRSLVQDLMVDWEEVKQIQKVKSVPLPLFHSPYPLLPTSGNQKQCHQLDTTVLGMGHTKLQSLTHGLTHMQTRDQTQA
jgi:hypothetical protein